MGDVDPVPLDKLERADWPMLWQWSRDLLIKNDDPFEALLLFY